MEAVLPDSTWESLHAPYDQPTYQAVLDQLYPGDNVLDIGAGDLRLARQMASIVRKVYAVEINPRVLDRAHAMHSPLPGNVVTICADARTLDFPTDITTGVLLMRHCTYFPLYRHKLRASGAVRLITNARWRMAVEVVNVVTQPPYFADVDMGWYACQCGRTGFKEGPAEQWSLEMDNRINEVSNCPQCR